LASIITQVPKFGEKIVDDDGRATRKFIKFLNDLDTLETTNTIEQSVQDAVGNLSVLQSYIARFRKDIATIATLNTDLTTINNELDDVENEVSANLGKIGQILAIIGRMAVDLSDLSQSIQSGNSFLIASMKRDLDRPFAPSFTVAQATANVWKAGSIIYVTNETGGATLAASNGTNWQRCADLTNIA